MWEMFENPVMRWIELRLLFRNWPVEIVNQLYIEMLEEQELGYY